MSAGWHWQLVASVAKQQEDRNSITEFSTNHLDDPNPIAKKVPSQIYTYDVKSIYAPSQFQHFYLLYLDGYY